MVAQNRVYTPIPEEIAALVRVIRHLVAVLHEVERAESLAQAKALALTEIAKYEGKKQ